MKCSLNLYFLRKLSDLISVTLVFFIFLVPISELKGQVYSEYNQADNVVLSTGEHVNFSDTIPQLINSNLPNFNSRSQFATYSDGYGNMRMYTNGCQVWNSSYDYMSGGVNVLPDCDTSNNSYGRKYRNIVLPLPGNSDIVYIFSVSSSPNFSNQYPDSLYYSIVNLNGNNGQGQLILRGQKFYSGPVEGYITAVKHYNGYEYWLLAKRHMSYQYIAFRFKFGGYVDTVYSNAGKQPYFAQNKVEEPGIVLSPDGRYLVDNTISLDTIQLLGFDAQTGLVDGSNLKFIVNPDYMVFPSMLAFSAEGSKLYSSAKSSTPPVYQYDLNLANGQDISNSAISLHSGNNTNSNYFTGDMFLAPDHNMYTQYVEYDTLFNTYCYLDRIQHPDRPGLKATYEHKWMIIDSTNNHEPKLMPDICRSWLMKPVELSIRNTCIGNQMPTDFILSDSVSHAYWTLGDSLSPGPDTTIALKPSHWYSQPGDYDVWAAVNHFGMWDTMFTVITISNLTTTLDLGPDTTIAFNDSITLDAGAGFEQYLWKSGDTSQSITMMPSQIGIGATHIWVEVVDTNGCVLQDTIVINKTSGIFEDESKSIFSIFPNPTNDKVIIRLDNPLKTDASIRIYTVEGKLMRMIEWEAGGQSHELDLSDLPDGIYWIELVNDSIQHASKLIKN